MLPRDQIQRTLELANRYYAPAVRAANQGLSVYRSIEPQLLLLAQQVRQAEDFPRYLLIKSFTFARGGWHDAPLAEASARAVRVAVKELADKPDEKVKAELDREIPEYFREDDHAALRGMVDRWDLFPGWRRLVFEDAFDAHKSGKYTLSVPALAPQIEGMLREVTNEHGRGNRYIDKVNHALGFSYNRGFPPPVPTAEELKGTLDELLSQDLQGRHEMAHRISLQHALLRVNELYNRVDFSDLKLADPANRHAILHGVAKDYDELVSVKLFCAVQLVHEIVDAYREATGQKTPR